MKHPTKPTFTHSSKSSYLFLTGATGLVGRFLIRDLLVKGYRLALLVRPTEKLTAIERVEVILQHWEAELEICLPRPVVLEGDVTQKDLGLSKEDVHWLTENCDQVIHNAAVLTFDGSDRQGEPWRTNLNGTMQFANLAKKIGARNWHYVSTAYVCGKRDGVVREDELDVGQTFRNDYEQSKFEAEMMMRAEADGFAKLTVYRPAVIVGDSETGFTCSYHGLFLYLRLIATLVPQQPRDANGVLQTPIHLPIDGDEPRNLVTVDWVSQVICRVIETPDAHGSTYHLSPEKFTTAREVIDFCYEYFNSAGVTYAGANQPIDEEQVSSFAEMFFANSRIYEPYQTDDPQFDRTNLAAVASDIPCPAIDGALIKKFIQFGTEDRWGKRRIQTPQVSSYFGEKLMGISNFSVLGATEPTQIGIDIHGPGGGQWQVAIASDGSEIRRGLPINPAIVITIDSSELNSETSSDDPKQRSFWHSVLASSLQNPSADPIVFPALSDLHP